MFLLKFCKVQMLTFIIIIDFYENVKLTLIVTRSTLFLSQSLALLSFLLSLHMYETSSPQERCATLVEMIVPDDKL